jgi:hypothetical protein
VHTGTPCREDKCRERESGVPDHTSRLGERRQFFSECIYHLDSLVISEGPAKTWIVQQWPAEIQGEAETNTYTYRLSNIGGEVLITCWTDCTRHNSSREKKLGSASFIGVHISNSRYSDL